eukprot:5293439-Amphidinium_carterae.1
MGLNLFLELRKTNGNRRSANTAEVDEVYALSKQSKRSHSRNVCATLCEDTADPAVGNNSVKNRFTGIPCSRRQHLYHPQQYQ